MLLACLRIVAGGEGANRRCDCDGYRPDISEGASGVGYFRRHLILMEAGNRC